MQATLGGVEPKLRDLRAVAAAIAVSTMGDFVAAIALALQTNELWEGIGVVGDLHRALVADRGAGRHAGLIVDRFETRAVAIVAALFQCVVAAALAFATGSITATLALAVLLGVGAAIGQSAEFALVPLLAGPRSIGRANGLVESARSLGFAVGPVVGGALAASVGTRWALLADSASFLLIAAALSSIAVRRRVSRAESAGFRARDGLAMLFAERTLGIAMAAGAVTLVFMSATIPADFVYTIDELGKSPLALGLVLTVWASAMILASILLAPRVPVRLDRTRRVARRVGSGLLEVPGAVLDGLPVHVRLLPLRRPQPRCEEHALPHADPSAASHRLGTARPSRRTTACGTAPS